METAMNYVPFIFIEQVARQPGKCREHVELLVTSTLQIRSLVTKFPIWRVFYRAVLWSSLVFLWSTKAPYYLNIKWKVSLTQEDFDFNAAYFLTTGYFSPNWSVHVCTITNAINKLHTIALLALLLFSSTVPAKHSQR